MGYNSCKSKNVPVYIFCVFKDTRGCFCLHVHTLIHASTWRAGVAAWRPAEGACPSWDAHAQEGPVQVDAGRRPVCAVQCALLGKQGFRVRRGLSLVPSS